MSKVDHLDWEPERISENYIEIQCWRRSKKLEQITMYGNFSLVPMKIILTKLNNGLFRVTVFPTSTEGDCNNSRIDLETMDIEGSLRLLNWALSSMPSALNLSDISMW